jgi:hypothetical protein
MTIILHPRDDDGIRSDSVGTYDTGILIVAQTFDMIHLITTFLATSHFDDRIKVLKFIW